MLTGLVAVCLVTLSGCAAKYAALLSSNEVIWDELVALNQVGAISAEEE